jgi:cellulose 1,4-beta-cellobiosidase
LTPLTRTLALPAALLAAGGILAVVSLPASSEAASSEAARSGPATTLCNSQTAPVDGGAYAVENNEWGSGARECITADGNAGFTVANSSMANVPNGAPGGYPAIYKGCHWGACTPGSGFPIKVSDIHAGTVTTSWSTSQPRGSNDYDVAYDIWFNQTPTASGQPNGTEMMIWLNHNGPVQPYGTRVASNVSIGGRGYNVWFGRQGWNTLSYTMTTGTTSVSKLDLQALVADAVSRGYLSRSWYLIDMEAGFELWHGGAGLATKSFSVNVAPGTPSPGPTTPVPSPTTPVPAPTTPVPAPTTPVPAPTTPVPFPTNAVPFPTNAVPFPTTPVPSPSIPAPTPSGAPTSSISLQAISPSPTTSGTATNATVDFKNTGSTMAANVTLVIEVLNSAGTVVGSQSMSGQNIAPQQTLSATYPWTASSKGKYVVEGLVRDSSGATLQHAQVGTLTVK